MAPLLASMHFSSVFQIFHLTVDQTGSDTTKDTLYFVKLLSFNLCISLLSLSTRLLLPNASPIYRIRDCTSQFDRSVMFLSNAGVLCVCLHSPTNSTLLIQKNYTSEYIESKWKTEKFLMLFYWMFHSSSG